MAPSLRPLPPPSSRHRSINPERASRRKVNSYREAGSDDDDIFVLDDPDGADFAPGYPLAPYGYVSPKKRTRRPEATITRDWEGHTSSDNTSTSPYNNSNNNNNNHSSAADLLSSSSHQINFVPELPPKITRSSPQHAKSSLFRKTRNKTAKIASSALSSPKKRKRANIAAYDPNAGPVNLAHVPPWQALPYHVLREVFSYAWEMSSHRPTTHHPHNVKWMLGVSRLCRSFFDAAIGVIWSSPPLYPITKLNRLHTLLATPQQELATNYRNKVRELDVHWPHYTAQKWQLVELVSHMPQLRRLSFMDYAQEAPGRAAQFLEWEKLFDAMDANEVRLRSWDWNAGVMRIPENVSLDALQTLRFVNFSEDLAWAAEEYTNDTAEYDGETPTLAWQLTQAIKALPTLRHLEFSCCSVVDERVLLNLPNTLQSLTLDGCKYLTSQTLSLFLASHGTFLKELTITHNPSLTLSFTTHLASLCPKLEILKFGFNADFHDEASLDDNDILLLSQTADEAGEQ
ncbi:hypothetical protein KEM56_004550 [Ascosphaera pollenicola]|nr:hypothetical protein KEM56_004550 [Ascosphaera pollenicola]